MKPKRIELHGNQRCLQLRDTFKTRSTPGHDLHVEVCSSSQPYTGKQIVDTAGRVDKFRKNTLARLPGA